MQNPIVILNGASKDPGIVEAGGYPISMIVVLHWANRAAIPLPQIYYPNGDIDTHQAQQWSWLSSYSATHVVGYPEYGIPQRLHTDFDFVGIMGDILSTSHRDLGESWQDLYQTLGTEGFSLIPLLMNITPIIFYP